MVVEILSMPDHKTRLQWKIDVYNELERRMEGLTQEIANLDFRWYQFWRLADRVKHSELKETLYCVRFAAILVGLDLAVQDFGVDE